MFRALRFGRPLAAAALLATLSAPSPAPVQAQAPVQARIGVDETRQLGTHRESGALLLYTPDPVQPGSTISHWDPSATPDLLMEPAINPGLGFLDLDVTPGLMADIGWPLVMDGGAGAPLEIDLFPLSPPGTGFDDPRPFAGAPGNPAATLGEARANLFEAVLGAWGESLSSDVPVDVLVVWLPLPCQEGAGAVLAGAAPLFVFADSDGAFPIDDTWYPSPLAEALTGLELSGPPSADGGGDVVVLVNSDLDQECLGEGTGLYYGLDGTPPDGLLDLAPVVLHELGHGLGFTSFTDEESGEELGGLPGVFDHFVFDEELGRYWPELSDGERILSARSFRDVTWRGPHANDLAAPRLGFGAPELEVTAPPEVAGSYEIGPAQFGAEPPPGGLSGEIACMVDAPDLPASSAGLADRTVFDGCGPAENPARIDGRIALIDRGQCSFVDKARNAQAAGAIAAIVVNNAGTVPVPLGGIADDVTIPVVSLGSRDGTRLRQAACAARAALLHDRFQVTVRWTRRRPGLPTQTGDGRAVQIARNAAWFYFVRPDNPQLLVKIVDACGQETPRWWVFSGGVTNQEVWITVTDTDTGAERTYHHPGGAPFETELDTDAFATCP
jgi:hypothetical protein